MRREDYEVAVSRPQVICQRIDGVLCEPWEDLSVDIEEQHQGAIMDTLGTRHGQLKNMQPDGQGRTRLDYSIPAQRLIGFQTEFMTLTSGSGLLYHAFERYAPVAKENRHHHRHNGALVSTKTGKALAFALFNLQERGRLLIKPNTEVYEGQLIGLHSKDNDLAVNPLKGKQLTNIRASRKDDSIILEPPIKLTLESALEIIEDDELVEITPHNIRIRKKLLHEHQRKQASRLKKTA